MWYNILYFGTRYKTSKLNLLSVFLLTKFDNAVINLLINIVTSEKAFDFLLNPNFFSTERKLFDFPFGQIEIVHI